MDDSNQHTPAPPDARPPAARPRKPLTEAERRKRAKARAKLRKERAKQQARLQKQQAGAGDPSGAEQSGGQDAGFSIKKLFGKGESEHSASDQAPSAMPAPAPTPPAATAPIATPPPATAPIATPQSDGDDARVAAAPSSGVSSERSDDTPAPVSTPEHHVRESEQPAASAPPAAHESIAAEQAPQHPIQRDESLDRVDSPAAGAGPAPLWSDPATVPASTPRSQQPPRAMQPAQPMQRRAGAAPSRSQPAPLEMPSTSRRAAEAVSPTQSELRAREQEIRERIAARRRQLDELFASVGTPRDH